MDNKEGLRQNAGGLLYCALIAGGLKTDIIRYIHTAYALHTMVSETKRFSK